jgi:hypothetical protein
MPILHGCNPQGVESTIDSIVSTAARILNGNFPGFPDMSGYSCGKVYDWLPPGYRIAL